MCDYIRRRDVEKCLEILSITTTQVNRVLYNWKNAGKEKGKYNVDSIFKSYLSRSCLKHMNHYYYNRLVTNCGPTCTIKDNRLVGIFIENGVTNVDAFKEALEMFNFNNPKYFAKEDRKKKQQEVTITNLIDYEKLNQIKF